MSKITLANHDQITFQLGWIDRCNGGHVEAAAIAAGSPHVFPSFRWAFEMWLNAPECSWFHFRLQGLWSSVKTHKGWVAQIQWTKSDAMNFSDNAELECFPVGHSKDVGPEKRAGPCFARVIFFGYFPYSPGWNTFWETNMLLEPWKTRCPL